MALPPEALLIREWAENGDRTLPESRTPALDRANGWTAAFSQNGGPTPAYEVFNQILGEITALLVYLRDHGALAQWNAAVAYAHPAFVVGSNGTPYQSKQDSTGIDPTTDTDGSHWAPIVDLPTASTTAKGIVELATTEQAGAGTSASLVVTPAGVRSHGDGRYVRLGSVPGAPADASTTAKGIVELATDEEAQTGTDTARAVTPAGLAARTPGASASRRGLVELATDEEAQAGTDTARAVTPAGLAAAIAAGNAASVDGFSFTKLTQTAYDELSDKDANTFYAIPPSSS